MINFDVTIVTRVDMVVVLITGTIIDFFPGISVDVLAGVDANMVAAAMTDLEFFDTRVSLEDALRCC